MNRRIVAIIALSVLTAMPLARAGTGKTWTASGREQFLKGKLEGLSLSSTGKLQLGVKLEKVPGLEANFVWDAVKGADDAVYVGTGAPACVYALREGKLQLLHKMNEKHVLSVLPLPDGAVLAATAPRGIIYRIGSKGQVTIFAELEEPYVWDMALDTDGGILCATGPHGKLLKLDSNGKAKELFKSEEKNLMCLAVAGKEGILVGTAPGGLLYRVSRKGAAQIVYDADESEVHCILVGPQGEVFVGTAQSTAATGGSRGASAAASAAMQRPPAQAEPSLEGKPPADNSIYRIRPGKGGVKLAQLPNTFVLSLVMDGRGRLLAGTGVKGRLVGVEEQGTTRILTQLEASQISSLTMDSSGVIYVATSNGGGLWRIEEGFRKSGTFTSEVFDAGYLSRWGRAWWKGNAEGGVAIKVSVRTGNSRKPNDHWGKWSPPVSAPDGGPLKVEPGRFAQVRAELTTKDPNATPSLIELNASYRQLNRRPHIQKLAVDDGQKLPAGPQQAKKAPGKRKISWQAADPNGDELVYDLFFKGPKEKEWKELEKGIRKKTQYLWDTNRLPDGHYLLRLIASDRFCCPPQEALSAEKISTPILVDNRRPAVLDLRASKNKDGSYAITGTAQDGYSNIKEIQVSHNSGDWQPVFPSDGILDSTRENFAFRTDVLPRGEHVFVFAATDGRGNAGSDRIVIIVE